MSFVLAVYVLKIWTECEKYLRCNRSDSNVKLAVSLGNMEHHLCLGHGLHNLVTVDGIGSVPEVKELVDKYKKKFKTVRYRLPEVELEAEKVQKEFLSSVEQVVQTLEIDESEPILQKICRQLQKQAPKDLQKTCHL